MVAGVHYLNPELRTEWETETPQRGMKDKKRRCRADSQGAPAAEEQSKGKEGRSK